MLESIMGATEPLTTEEFLALDVDEKLKVELIGGALVMHACDPYTANDLFALDVDQKLKVELIGGALVIRAASKPWHDIIAFELRDALAAALGPDFVVCLGLCVCVDDENILRPDLIVVRSEPLTHDRAIEAAKIVFAMEVMSPSSQLYDRRHKPSLYRDCGIPSWRIERSGHQLALFEIPFSGDEVTHLGQITLKVADIDVPIDLDEIARYAFR